MGWIMSWLQGLGIELVHWPAWLPSLAVVLSFGVVCLAMRVYRYWRRPRPHFFFPPKAEPSEAVEEPPRPLVSHRRRPTTRPAEQPVAVQLSDAIAEAPPRSALVVERSSTGVTWNADQPLEAGSLVTMRLAGASANVPWAQLEVRHCNQVGPVWRASGRFTKTPPWVVLLLFEAR